MHAESSVSGWLEALEAGDPEAARRLWDRYFDRLVRLARRKLGGAPRRAADEEDVALSAFKSLCLGAARGQFSDLSDRTQLWKLLVVITARKATARLRHERRLRRGGGKVRGESVLDLPAGEGPRGLEQIVGREPTGEFALAMSEEYERLLDCLDDGPQLREIALLKLEGYTNAEIAERIGRTERTVERRLHLIRKIWDEAES